MDDLLISHERGPSLLKAVNAQDVLHVSKSGRGRLSCSEATGNKNVRHIVRHYGGRLTHSLSQALVVVLAYGTCQSQFPLVSDQ